MFDPTAFENMKVVLDGGFYDRDLSGEIRIIDRNDVLNSAKMSRSYEVAFKENVEGHEDITCTFTMEAGLKNLAAELLPEVQSEKQAGCKVYIKFTIKQKNDLKLFQETREILRDIWGRERNIIQIAKFNPEEMDKQIEAESVVNFNRLIYEEQIDDLSDMIAYMIASLQALRNIRFS
ncbi:hypothetical protein J7I93_13275 [Bacillus sp. ISL-47]|uniref:hypothetical protein n=1 Tax=Bacillus sp. ISL-47 TaxID=2819130 RepID=UPI001BE644E2|nr:hypothetical protein [Bacillus sp. ISL-47]MBT2689158.1 hypothetical protein [Bacillus sp. ISL-47]MBT2708944.1 hypothetical protein [Pseudomonas sp. ISL-84]